MKGNPRRGHAQRQSRWDAMFTKGAVLARTRLSRRFMFYLSN